MISIRLGSTSNGAVSTFAVDTSADNGLTALLVRDNNQDSFADTAYAGDLEGTVWKISGIGGSPSALALFHAEDGNGNSQPITAAPMVGRDPATGNLWVFVGTGRYLHESDIGDDSVQSWYGLIDNNTAISGRNELVERRILVEATVAGVPARVIEEGSAADIVGRHGWYIDLVSPGVDGEQGERMVVQNRFQGEALIGTTRIPGYTDACNPGGTGFVMAINPFTGGRLASTFFDVSGDGISNQADMYCDGNGCVPVSGIGFSSSPNNPIFVENVMQVGLDSGETRTIRTFGSAVEARRMSWRELFNE
jgi:type IV pilus assembly protein PilY1